MITDNNIRYIVFMIDSKIKEHDGMVFKSHKWAKDYAIESITDKYCDKIVIGMFQFDPGKEEMIISYVESMGFKGDKKDVAQTDLFRASVKT